MLRMFVDGTHYAIVHSQLLCCGGSEKVLWSTVLGILDADPEARISLYTTTSDRTPESIIGASSKYYGIDLEARISTRLRVVLVDELPGVVQAALRLVVPEHEMWRVNFIISMLLRLVLSLEPRPFVAIETFQMPYMLLFYKLVSAGATRTVAYSTFPYLVHGCSGSGFEDLGCTTGFWAAKFVVRMSLDELTGDSKWTCSRNTNLFGVKCDVVYPPVEYQTNKSISELPKHIDSERTNAILSIGRISREKDHAVQIRVLHLVRQKIRDAELWIVGSLYDHDYLKELKQLATELQVTGSIKWLTGVSKVELLKIVKKPRVAIHTMTDEHFGISVVDLMSYMIPVVVSNSGGPKEDIILSRNNDRKGEFGFLSDSVDDYVRSVVSVLANFGSQEVTQLRINAYNSVFRFPNVELFGKLMFSKIVPSAQ